MDQRRSTLRLAVACAGAILWLITAGCSTSQVPSGGQGGRDGSGDTTDVAAPSETGGQPGSGGAAGSRADLGSPAGGDAGPSTGGRGSGGAGAGGTSGAAGDARDAAADLAADLVSGRDARAGRDGDGGNDGGDARAPDGRDAAMEAAGSDSSVPFDAGTCPAPGAGSFAASPIHLDIPVHDPAMISDGKRFYLFGTGGTLTIRSSADGLQWTSAGKVFAAVPGWVTTTLGASASGFDLWAPDVSFFACQYHVYYAGSTFGSNTSVIGLATSPALDPKDPSYGWTDQGLVLRSTSSDSFNAIDPNVAFDDAGQPWLAFGSFWDGIKMRKLDPATGKPSPEDTTLYALASRKGTGDAIEAASIVSHNGYYYLFVSFDACCKGTDSTYRTMVGRGTKITGPYTNKAGTAMTKGAAEELLASQGRYIGPGGGTAFRNGDAYYYAFHYYDGEDNGNSKLQIRPIVWASDDWPTLADPLFP